MISGYGANLIWRSGHLLHTTPTSNISLHLNFALPNHTPLKLDVMCITHNGRMFFFLIN